LEKQKPSKKPSGIPKKVGNAHAIQGSTRKSVVGRLGQKHP